MVVAVAAAAAVAVAVAAAAAAAAVVVAAHSTLRAQRPSGTFCNRRRRPLT